MSADEMSPEVEGWVRGLIRGNFSDPDAPVDSCTVDDCEVSFLGMTATDYAVHLVEHHQFYRNGLRVGDENCIKSKVHDAIKATENEDGGQR